MRFVEVLISSFALLALAQPDDDPSLLYKFVNQENWSGTIEYSAIGGFYPQYELELI
jgi:hypothetical protein